MGDLRNKMRKEIERARQEEWLAKNCPPRTPEWACRPRCQVCGAKDPCVIQPGRWEPTLYRCPDHLPDWAAYVLENDDRQDRMCNLYSITKGQAAIRELARAMRDLTGNLEPLPAVLGQHIGPVSPPRVAL